VGGDLAGAGVDLGAALGIVQVGLDHHLLIGEGGPPAELFADVVVSKTKSSAIMR